MKTSKKPALSMEEDPPRSLKTVFYVRVGRYCLKNVAIPRGFRLQDSKHKHYCSPLQMQQGVMCVVRRQTDICRSGPFYLGIASVSSVSANTSAGCAPVMACSSLNT